MEFSAPAAAGGAESPGFSASAPAKAILFGEHYVVYGSPALALAIEPRNAVGFGGWAGGGIALKSELGDGIALPGGRYEGTPELGIFAAVASAVFGNKPLPPCTASFKPAWKLKGVGTSASLCAAFAAGLFRLKGKKAAPREIFAAAQAGDLIAHGGRASGIDAKTASFGCPLVFQRGFSPPAFNSRQAAFSLPEDCSLLLIDTFRGKKDGTAKMLEIFASQFGIAGAPAEASEEQRQRIMEEYSPLWKEIEKNFRAAPPKKLGALMDENHALLKNRRMSSPGIEKAVSSALSAGAYGAKITGAGGEGGAVMVLCDREKGGDMRKKISDTAGYTAYPIILAKKGASAD